MPADPETRCPRPEPEGPLWTLRWHCPRCRQVHDYAARVPRAEHRRALGVALAPASRFRCTCGGTWRSEQVGWDWEPEPDAPEKSTEGQPR